MIGTIGISGVREKLIQSIKPIFKGTGVVYTEPTMDHFVFVPVCVTLWSSFSCSYSLCRSMEELSLTKICFTWQRKAYMLQLPVIRWQMPYYPERVWFNKKLKGRVGIRIEKFTHVRNRLLCFESSAATH